MLNMGLDFGVYYKKKNEEIPNWETDYNAYQEWMHLHGHLTGHRPPDQDVRRERYLYMHQLVSCISLCLSGRKDHTTPRAYRPVHR